LADFYGIRGTKDKGVTFNRMQGYVPANRNRYLNDLEMTDDLMRYDQLAQNALRGVVREALRHVQRAGLPGEHHFYIAFNTRYPGVRISDKLLQRHPREMTIVLQHQYSDLTISEEQFSVVLYFDQKPEQLVVPFNSIKGFLDPAVQFGLQFEVVPVDAQKSNDPQIDNVSEFPVAEVVTGDATRANAEITPLGAPEMKPANDKVVSLDAFRKK
jgi:uncharacterized protein